MRRTASSTLTAWLCLALALVSGVSQASGPVLCFEPGRTPHLDSALLADCCADASRAAPVTDHASGATASTPAHGCVCLDVPLVSSSDSPAPRAAERVQPSRFLPAWTAAAAASHAVEPGSVRALELVAPDPGGGAPRLLRSVRLTV